MEAVVATTGHHLPDPHASPPVFKKSFEVVAAERSAGNSGIGEAPSSPAAEVLCNDMSHGAADRVGGNGSSRNGGVSTSKGKRKTMVPEDDSSPSRIDDASRQPPKKKVMHDAMAWKSGERRTSDYCHEASGSTNACHAEKKMTCHDYKFGDNQQVSQALLVGLAEHGASAPWFVDSKQLTDTDARLDQNRLQFPRSSPISQVFTAAEKARTWTNEGLMVMAFDRRGTMYPMKFRFFGSKFFCRLMGKWGDFLRDNHLGIGKKDTLGGHRIIVEVWAFRSHALPNCEEGQEFDCGHPDGMLGLVVLHREEDEAGDHEVALEAPDEEAEVEGAEEEAAVVVEEHLELAAASVQEDAAPAESVQAQEDAPAAIVHEEVPAGADAENGEAGADAASYESKFLQVVAAMLLVLRTSNRTRCRNDDKDVES